MLKVRDRLFYGWVVVITCFIIAAIIFGISYSFGVFFKSLEGEFNLNRGATSAVFSLYMVLYSVFGILGGWALDRYGPRIITIFVGLFTGLSLLLTSQAGTTWQLFITYGLLLAIGVGPSYVMVMSTASRWFNRKRGLALGIVGSGSGLGMLLIAPFATYLISNIDWRMTYVAIGLIAWLVVIPLFKLMRKDPSELGLLPDGARLNSNEEGSERLTVKNDTKLTDFSLLQAFRTENYWFIAAIWLLYGFCYLLVLTHIVPHATDTGIPAMNAAFIISLMGGSNLAGRLLMGRVSDSLGRKNTGIICSLLVVGTMVWLLWARDLWMFYLFGIVCGFFFGGLDPCITALIGDTFGLRNIGIIMGTLNVTWGLGSAIGPYLGGLVYDVNGDYFWAFLAGGVAMLMVALLIALIRPEIHRNL
jgi:MFS family permease